ncbi:tRNA pseudouridine(38-40) synthase TruA [Ornithinibacillus bavariensis]|uniref:tRNA pseudouridine synthase A n=1 Tax=Ornithinibacillus bavariensis TaxID=545502 RepID=A0A919X9X6_9BACI|nr:tRNA pseudouridine(38-40) synthase TruA [Ornithinibacillus bavariensis]GIO28746.1 tRNA pseudouridine synthase A 1 [Ornithinibacillus bavariensis]
MPKIKCILQYDGSNFFGYQVQPEKRTVQGELEKALERIHKGEKIRVHASGRTDTGVHAKGQTIHFETKLYIPGNSWGRALNSLLPEDLHVKASEEVPESFHARYDVLEKEYRYFILNRKEPDIFARNYSYHFPYKINIEAIQEACRYLEGTHDFTTFSSARATVKGDKVRTLFEVSCQKNGDQIEFHFRGSGFLYNMVRILVGTLLEVGQGKIDPINIREMLEKKDRRLAGKTAPAQGLFLWKVVY